MYNVVQWVWSLVYSFFLFMLGIVDMTSNASQPASIIASPKCGVCAFVSTCIIIVLSIQLIYRAILE